jgi:hypothetical protein
VPVEIKVESHAPDVPVRMSPVVESVKLVPVVDVKRSIEF